ncbi:hypothetical protein [Bythopirellula polymerisocia]|uniref:Carboxypeptidase regulatory-like domain-containing protein n=1 Tax=Bythopirellula polymerisocia TaxID=2528003 RepID=A0A5C6CB81_9BACT|nr:hypothetical protein [Bythopirellula polymerisocia]TWU21345.1 hypothetical protein Pla144_45650 [Bythopirellula polymerisocia]
MSKSSGLVAAILLAVALAGCGRGLTVSGVVEYSGKRVEKGYVQFQPREGSAVAVELNNGEYTVSETKDLLPGEYTVRIFGEKETGRFVKSPDTQGPGNDRQVKEIVEYLPPKYNYETKLTVALVEGENKHDFLLEK